MEIFLAILAVLCAIIGVLGSIVPAIPGPPIAFLGLLLANWSGYADFTSDWLVMWAVITGVITILDYFLPIWFTKRLGGSKQATRGATIGVIVGMFFGIWGILLGPFLGALIGELFHNREDNAKAFRVAMGSFVAFIFGTGVKLVAACFMGFHIVKAIFF